MRFRENLGRWMRQYQPRWWGWTLLALFGGLLLIRWWLPHFVQREIVKRLSAATPATVNLVDVKLNLLQGQLILKGLSLTLPGEERAVLTIDELAGRVRYSSLLHGQTEIDEVQLSKLRAAVVLQADGALNLAKLLPSAHSDTPPTPQADLPQLTVQRINLTDAEMSFQDHTRAPAVEFQLTLDEVSTGALRLQGNGLAAPVEVRVHGALQKEPLASTGQVWWTRAETKVEATVEAQQFPLVALSPYWRDSLSLPQLTGQVHAQLHYHLHAGKGVTPVHALDGAISLAQVAFADPLSGQTAVQFKQGHLAIEKIDLAKHEVRLSSIVIQEPKVFALLTPTGMNLATLTKTSADTSRAEAQKPEGTSSWRIAVQEVKVAEGNLVYHDNSWANDETIPLKLEEVQLQNIASTVTENPFRFRVRQGESSMTGEGAVRFSPLRIDAHLHLAELELAPFQPFLKKAGLLKPASGKLHGALHTVLATQEGVRTVSIDGSLEAPAFALSGLPTVENTMAWDTGHLEIRAGSSILPLHLDMAGQFAHVTLQHLPQGDLSIGQAQATFQVQQQAGVAPASPPSVGAPAPEPALATLTVQGEFDVQNFLVSQGPEKQELVSCHHTKGRILEGSRLSPVDIYLADVALEYPYVQGFRTASGHIQIAKPTSESPSPTDAHGAASAASEQATQNTDSSPDRTLAVHVDQIVLIGGQLYVEDHAIAPVQTIYWQDIRIDLSDAAYPLVRPSAFALHAFNMDGTPVEASGTTKRKDGVLVTTIHGKIERLRLPRFNAYLAPFLGYQVRKGAVSIKWEIAMPGDFVQANASVTLHDLGLSGKQSTSEVEQEVGLPMHLIIALLKDLNGNINLRVPVEGRLSEPGFQVGSSMWQAIRDVLIGAVTSPLKLLGAIFHKSDTLQDFTLDPIPFVPGSSQPTLVGKEQIERLRVFLVQRPELDLQLNSAASPVDRDALQDQLILAQLSANAPSSAQAQASIEQSQGAPELSPEEEVRQFLLRVNNQRLEESVSGQEKLSPQAATLLASLRKTVLVGTTKLEQLAQSRLQTVATALTGNTGIRADRLHPAPDNLHGSGNPEVQYMIQAREKQ